MLSGLVGSTATKCCTNIDHNIGCRSARSSQHGQLFLLLKLNFTAPSLPVCHWNLKQLTFVILYLILTSFCYCLADDVNGYHASTSTGSLQGQSAVNTKPVTCSHCTLLQTLVKSDLFCLSGGWTVGEREHPVPQNSLHIFRWLKYTAAV